MEKESKIWFKAKRYGWGWYPATKEGWLVIIGYLVLVVGVEVVLGKKAVTEPSFYDVTVGGLFIFVLTAFLIWICFKKGEKPGWRWGGK